MPNIGIMDSRKPSSLQGIAPRESTHLTSSHSIARHKWSDISGAILVFSTAKVTEILVLCQRPALIALKFGTRDYVIIIINMGVGYMSAD